MSEGVGRVALPFARSNWRSRWLVLPSWNVLHRIAEIEWLDPEQWIRGEGVAVCGARGEFAMPGIFSRMVLPRCKHCCRALGIPNGPGAPYNEHIREPGEEGWG